MRESKRKKLDAKGWKIGTPKDFLGMSDEEESLPTGASSRLDTSSTLVLTRSDVGSSLAWELGCISDGD